MTNLAQVTLSLESAFDQPGLYLQMFALQLVSLLAKVFHCLHILAAVLLPLSERLGFLFLTQLNPMKSIARQDEMVALHNPLPLLKLPAGQVQRLQFLQGRIGPSRRLPNIVHALRHHIDVDVQLRDAFAQEADDRIIGRGKLTLYLTGVGTGCDTDGKHTYDKHS